MALNAAFRGHGTFCYLPDATARHYRDYPGPGAPGSPGRFAAAAHGMGMSHVWVRLFGLEGPMPAADTRRMVDALRTAGINVAGWGYCHGRNADQELALAKQECDRHAITAFVADIEPGRLLGGTKSKWDLNEFSDFIDGLVAKFGGDNLGISTWPVLKIQNDPQYPSLALMRRVAGRVAMFAPQAYWMTYPTTVHYNATGFSEARYRRNDPASFVKLVIDSWRADGFTQPLVVTGQAYWGEGAPETSVIEAKLAKFTRSFSDWDKIVGFNWWHAGGNKAMSASMRATLQGARLNERPFSSPQAGIESVARGTKPSRKKSKGPGTKKTAKPKRTVAAGKAATAGKPRKVARKAGKVRKSSKPKRASPKARARKA